MTDAGTGVGGDEALLRLEVQSPIPAFEKCTPRPHDLMAQLQLIRLGAAGRPDQTGIWN